MNAVLREGPWSTALPEWKEALLAGGSLVPHLPLHVARADKALAIFKELRVPDIEGQPRYGDVCAQFVFDLVRAIFGAFDQNDQRMIREYFLMIPKKNGKSSISAAIIVTAAILNERPHAELLLIAPTMQIAGISYKQATGIIKCTVMPSGVALSDLFTVHAHIRTIRILNQAIPSEITIKAADTDVVTGSKASTVLIDETHVFASKSAAKGVFLEIRGALSHPQNKGFLLQITTQSKTPPHGVFKAELDRAREVRDSKLSLPLLPVLYELPPAKSANHGWRNEALWGCVNPHMGRSVDRGFLADALRAADEDGPEAVALFASQHLNVQIGQSEFAESWPGVAFWEGAAESGLTLKAIMDRSEVCVVGIDGGGLDDLMALVIIGRERVTRRWLHWVRAWAHPEVFERRKEISERLRGFITDGDLVLCKSPDHDAQEMAAICGELDAAGLLPEKHGIGLDAFGVATVVDALEGAGLGGERVVAVPQGYKLQSAVVTLPRRLKDKSFVHGGSPLMGWAVGNAKTELKGSSYVVTKQVAGAAKIDPLMATFNAAMLMFSNPVAPRSFDLDGYLQQMGADA